MVVNIVDVCCKISKAGEIIGHEDKAIRQAIDILDKKCVVTIGKEYSKNAYQCKKNGYLFCCRNSDNVIKKYIKIMINIIISILKNKHNIIWFIYVEEIVLILLALIPQRAKIVITTYRDWEDKLNNCKIFKKLRLYLYRKALKKINLLILTNPNYKVENKSIYLPDFYLEPKYDSYIKKKKEGIVCVGIMSCSKQVLEIAKVFNESDMGIHIEGYFDDICYYEEVLKYSNDRVIIKNSVLNYDEYMKLIGNAKYVLIPYVSKRYQNKTSGVLQETVALNSIPIGEKGFLEYNHVSGISYEDINEIPDKIINYEESAISIKNNYLSYNFEQCKKIFKAKLVELE